MSSMSVLKLAGAVAGVAIASWMVFGPKSQAVVEKGATSTAMVETTKDKSAMLTPELLEAYQRDGYIVIRGFLTPAELEMYRNETERVMEGKPGVRKDMHTASDFFGAELAGGGQYNVMRTLVGDALINNMCGYFDKPMDKDSPTPPTIEPHKDGGGVLDGATMWIALDDADVKNGCMWYTPGSHLEAIDPDAPPNFGTLPEGRTGGVPAEAKAGDVIVHSARTIHFSNQVTEMRRRRALTFFYWSKQSADNSTLF